MFRFFVFLLIMLASCAVMQCGIKDVSVNGTCCQRDVSNAFLNTAIAMISEARFNYSAGEDCLKNQKPFDCADIFQMSHNASGVYQVWLKNREFEDKPIFVFCDMETDGGGWTVIQRRGNFDSPHDYFYKSWKRYKEGFGDLKKDFWLGNDYIFALTNLKHHSVRFDLEDFEHNKKYALYDTFWIDGECNKYMLHISDYRGNAGESMHYHNMQKFSTMDQDNDSNSSRFCAHEWKGGWWYNSCYHANLNSLYYNDEENVVHKDGITWDGWYKNYIALKKSEIKIRPKNFRFSK